MTGSRSEYELILSFMCCYILIKADKEFVWSLWRRLQSTRPDLTAAITMVVERLELESFKQFRLDCLIS